MIKVSKLGTVVLFYIYLYSLTLFEKAKYIDEEAIKNDNEVYEIGIRALSITVSLYLKIEGKTNLYMFAFYICCVLHYQCYCYLAFKYYSSHTCFSADENS